MKHLIKIAYAMMMSIFIVLSSCDSSDEKELKKTEETKDKGILTYSMLVKDSEGKELLSNAYSNEHYCKDNVVLKSLNENESVDFEISATEQNGLSLSVSVDGVFPEGESVHKLIIQWGLNLMGTIDTITCEIEKNEELTECKKIWVNSDLKWNEENASTPLFTLIKPKYIKRLPDAKPLILSNPEKVTSDNTFALNLFKEACKEQDTENGENVLVSPLSVNYALNLLLNGSAGTTRDQIMATLSANGYTPEQMNQYGKELSDALMSTDPSTTLRIANSLWAAPTFPLKAPFVELNQTYYDAEVKNINFGSPDALGTINAWCAEKTNNLIPKVLAEIPSETLMMLINTLYFKSNWSEGTAFNSEFTEKENFTLSDGTTKEVNMMKSKETTHLFMSDDHAYYLKKPFGNSAFNFTVILPKEDKDIEEVITNIDQSSWTTSKDMSYKETNLSLPRFKIGCEYNLEKNILPSMGMTIPFSGNADFSLISDVGFQITQILHEAVVEINEEGAEAAAVTIVTGATSSPPEDIIDFTVDRPFLFAICENSTGLILFMGKVGDPQE